jgi:hypothetical protein
MSAAFAAPGIVRAEAQSASPPASRGAAGADVTGRLARYMVAARDRQLSAPAARDAKQRILDTIGAMVSGAVLPPGVLAIRYVRAQGGTAEASVLTTDIRTSAVNAALANGMFAHADETDDFEPVTKAHPGPRSYLPRSQWRNAKGAREPNSSVPSRSATTSAADS